MKKHKKKKKSEEIQLNLAAMLDMAFQLLTFFILTFRPTPMEGQLAVNLPPPVAITDPNQKKPEVESSEEGSGVNPFETLNMYVTANSEGEATEIRVGKRTLSRGRLDERQLSALSRSLGEFFALTPYERVQIIADGKLHYGELMKVIEICTRQKLTSGEMLHKISFVQQDEVQN